MGSFYKGEHIVFVKIDIEKVYHKIEQCFILFILKALMFVYIFLKYVNILFEYYLAILYLNSGHPSSTVLFRSVQQGFPWLPLLLSW